MTAAPRPPTRGPYAKGVARRREIVDAALDVLAVNSFQNSSLDEIARRVGITRQGLLHYFGSKDNLIIAVLQERDARDIAAGLGGRPLLTVGRQRHAAFGRSHPGVTRPRPPLHRLRGRGDRPRHPAHEFFRHRYDDIRRPHGEVSRRRSASGASTLPSTPGRPVSRSSASSTGCSSNGCSTPTSTRERRCGERYRLSSHLRPQPARPPWVTPPTLRSGGRDVRCSPHVARPLLAAP